MWERSSLTRPLARSPQDVTVGGRVLGWAGPETPSQRRCDMSRSLRTRGSRKVTRSCRCTWTKSGRTRGAGEGSMERGRGRRAGAGSNFSGEPLSHLGSQPLDLPSPEPYPDQPGNVCVQTGLPLDWTLLAMRDSGGKGVQQREQPGQRL